MTWGIYAHIPWCHRRCPYCAFYVEREANVDWGAFVAAMLAEYDQRSAGELAPCTFPNGSKYAWSGQPTTLFMGGGTPSRMPAPFLQQLIRGLDLAPNAEISIEANPEDITEQWLEGALTAGINRISMGVQTFNGDFARLLNRNSSVQDARATVARVAKSGVPSWSIDLIFGLPGQTLDAMYVDLMALLETDPPHVSLYGLTYEPGTPFGRAKDAGRMKAIDDDTWRNMYDTLVRDLDAAGLKRYEISNFAKAGHECIHNQNYWQDTPYLGLGPSAHGYAPDGSRWINTPDADAYLKKNDPTGSHELPSARGHAIDILISAMRTTTGLQIDWLNARTGHIPDEQEIRALQEMGLLVRTPGTLALTNAGFPVADTVIARLASALPVH